MTRTVLTSLALVLVGCSSAGTPDAPLAMHLDGSTLILDVPPNDHRKVQTCDLFSGVDKQTQSGWVPLVDDLPGDLYQRSTFRSRSPHRSRSSRATRSTASACEAT